VRMGDLSRVACGDGGCLSLKCSQLLCVHPSKLARCFCISLDALPTTFEVALIYCFDIPLVNQRGFRFTGPADDSLYPAYLLARCTE